MKRKAYHERKTKETGIIVELTIDGAGSYSVKTPVGFFTHMLETFTRHGSFDLSLVAEGDTSVDQHYLIEDTGITVGEVFKKALGDKKGITG